jgi:hypothetical protein
MTLKQVIQVTIGLAAVSILLPFQNCSKATFSAAPNSIHAASSCYHELQRTTEPVKAILVLDMSGSNWEGIGSDPDKSVRAGSMQEFYNEYKTKTNFSWGLIAFKSTYAMGLLNGGSQANEVFGDAAKMQAGINYFSSIKDELQTPYKAAIRMVSDLISSDTSASPTTRYVVVFLSDGNPTDYPNTAAGNTSIRNDVGALVDLRPDHISFNSIYYGPADADASSRMHMMADVGKGQFLDTNNNPSGKTFNISDVIGVPGSNCTANQ